MGTKAGMWPHCGALQSFQSSAVQIVELANGGVPIHTCITSSPALLTLQIVRLNCRTLIKATCTIMDTGISVASSMSPLSTHLSQHRQHRSQYYQHLQRLYLLK